MGTVLSNQLTMKLLICLFALIVCAYAAPQADLINVEGRPFVRYANGAVVPSLTPSVAAATHAHLATKFAYPYFGLYGYYDLFVCHDCLRFRSPPIFLWCIPSCPCPSR